MRPYEYQEQAARLLREERRNLLVIAPTGAGKTEVGFTGLEITGKGVYVAPTRALCHEKASWLRAKFPESRVVIGNKDYSLTLGGFRGSEIRVLTPWKLGVVIHNDPNFAQHCPLVVVDEIHGLNPEIELVITKMKELFPKVRIVGLSATIHEDDRPRLAAWLNAAVVESHIRPVPLMTRVVHFDADLDEVGEEVTNVSFTEGGREFEHRQLSGFTDSLNQVATILDHIRESGDQSPVLVYTPYRERARNLAQLLSEKFGNRDQELALATEGLPAEAGDFTDTIKSVLPLGIGIHHGGCTQQERELIFDLALAGKLPIVVTCQTLAQGINLPARHVIFESVYDEPEGQSERRLMDVSKFWQIAGRAGRPQFDSIGFAWVAVSSEIELAEVEEVLLKQKASRIESRLYDEYFLTGHVAGLIQLGYTSPVKLVEFLRASFFGATLSDSQPLVEQFERIISRLIAEGFAITVGKTLVLSDRGQRLARLGLHPAEYAVVEELVRSESTEYETWVRQLAAVCGEYVWRNRPVQDEVIEEVVALGMTAYSVKASWAVREMVDYLSRLLELAFSFMRFNRVDEDYQHRFKQDVADRFLFGQIEFARKLSAVLSRSAVKRVLRNFGPSLTVTDQTTGEDKSLALDDVWLKNFAKVVWSQTELPQNGKLGRVAGVLGVTEARLRRLAEEALAAPEKKEEVRHV